jgi:hypothetical protein
VSIAPLTCWNAGLDGVNVLAASGPSGLAADLAIYWTAHSFFLTLLGCLAAAQPSLLIDD